MPPKSLFSKVSAVLFFTGILFVSVCNGSRYGYDIYSYRNEYDNALMNASDRGQYKEVEMLLKKGNDPNMRHKDGNTALIAAAVSMNKIIRSMTIATKRQFKETIEALLRAGADPNIKNNEGNTALTEFSKKENKEIIDVILALNNMTDRNDDGSVSFAQAAENRQLTSILLEAGADPDEQNEFGDTALIMAARKGDAETVKLLLVYKADPNVQNKFGIRL